MSTAGKNAVINSRLLKKKKVLHFIFILNSVANFLKQTKIWPLTFCFFFSLKCDSQKNICSDYGIIQVLNLNFFKSHKYNSDFV